MQDERISDGRSQKLTVTANKVSTAADIIYFALLICGVFQLIIGGVLFFSVWNQPFRGGFGFMAIMPLIMIPVSIFLLVFSARLIKYGSELLVLIAFSLADGDAGGNGTEVAAIAAKEHDT